MRDATFHFPAASRSLLISQPEILSTVTEFQLVSTFAPAGSQPEAIKAVNRRSGKGRTAPDPARRHRLRQDLHDGKRDRGMRSRPRSSLPTTRRLPPSSMPSSAISSRKTGSSTSSPTTTTTSPSPTSRQRTSISRRTRPSTPRSR